MKTPNPDRTQSPPFYRLYIPVMTPEEQAEISKRLRVAKSRKERKRTRETGIE